LPLAEIRIQTEKTRLQQRLRQMRRLRLGLPNRKAACTPFGEGAGCFFILTSLKLTLSGSLSEV
ncbi:hypothetical protein QZH63_07295, partial [Eikenella corrodens]|nr:hypothetical protein [Eikenella corrodens]